MRAADRALELKPDWERAALLKADLLAKTSPEGAIRYSERVPRERARVTGGDRGARSALCRAEALQRGPRDVPAPVRRGQVGSRRRVRGRRAIRADEGLCDRRALFRGSAAAQAARRARSPFYLAQIAEDTKRYDEAIARYREVTDGERGVDREAAHRRDDRQEGRRAGGAPVPLDAQAGQSRPRDRGRARPKRRSCATPAITRAPTTCLPRRWRRIRIPPICSTTRRWSPKSSTASTRSNRG